MLLRAVTYQTCLDEVIAVHVRSPEEHFGITDTFTTHAGQVIQQGSTRSNPAERQGLHLHLKSEELINQTKVTDYSILPTQSLCGPPMDRSSTFQKGPSRQLEVKKLLAISLLAG